MSKDPKLSRRRLLKGTLSGALAASLGHALHPAIARALDIEPARVTGTIKDVEHVVILTQENRSFDHYFGSLYGVRGFADRFAIPAPDVKARKNQTVMVQPDENDDQAVIAPFHLNTQQDFRHMRVEGTPHSFTDAQSAWDDGRLSDWTKVKHNHSMGYYKREDIPFQFALAEAFTLCDAYHCSIHAGTNPNRTFMWTGTNDAKGDKGGPVIDNGYDTLGADPKGHGGYDWMTYPERLQAAGISWQVYQDMKNNFTDNSLVGFKTYRAADKATNGPLVDLANRSVRTRALDAFAKDVMAANLPQVSWIVAGDTDSEHPGPSSPAQGADFTARVLEALTANPSVFAKTVFLINYDENDGFFDHVAPPAPPVLDGAEPMSQVPTIGEYHTLKDKYKGRAYGLGPRVPMFVVSPWSKGGFVASEVFDHTSVIRFLEARFGVMEPNISSWRRAVCGDLTSCFDFKAPDHKSFFEHLPKTSALSLRAKALGGRTTPKTPKALLAPVQEKGVRPRRPTPYDIEAKLVLDRIEIFRYIYLKNNNPDRAAVFNLYDRLNLSTTPKRFTIAAQSSRHVLIPTLKSTGATIEDVGAFDLWLDGPNGFHRHFKDLWFSVFAELNGSTLRLVNGSTKLGLDLTVTDKSYGAPAQRISLLPLVDKDNTSELPWIDIELDFTKSHGWYDFTLEGDGFYQRFAGHIEDGKPSFSDPAAHGKAKLIQ